MPVGLVVGLPGDVEIVVGDIRVEISCASLGRADPLDQPGRTADVAQIAELADRSLISGMECLELFADHRLSNLGQASAHRLIGLRQGRAR